MVKRWWALAPALALALSIGTSGEAGNHRSAQHAAPAPPPGPAIALTFDDIPAHGPLPAGTTRLDVINAIIAALKTAHAPAFGFVNGGFGADDPQSPAVMAAWRAAGLPLGNHTFNHLNLSANAAPDFIAQAASNEGVIAPLMQAADWHWFRYPFLAEGDTAEKRDAVRAWLAAHHYRIAAVTDSFSDFAWNSLYAGCAAKNDPAIIEGLERGFLEAARQNALRDRALARRLYGRDVPLVLLMHVGAFSAHMLPRLLAEYRALGFRFVTLEKAERDAFYAPATNPRLPGPSPTLQAAAAARGIPVAADAPVPDGATCR